MTHLVIDHLGQFQTYYAGTMTIRFLDRQGEEWAIDCQETEVVALAHMLNTVLDQAPFSVEEAKAQAAEKYPELGLSSSDS